MSFEGEMFMDNFAPRDAAKLDDILQEKLNEIVSTETEVLTGLGKANEVRAQRDRRMHQRTLAPS